ncbi:MAG: alpha/beta hydrolase [Pseudomonadota bacterium]
MAATCYVLVHGSWMGGEAWDSVATRLRSVHGLEVHTPTQAGHGPDAASRQVTHDEAVQSIVDYIEDKDLTDFVLLGHSFGGTIIQKVAEAIPQRIRRLVFWNAFVLEDGECLNDHVPPGFGDMFDALRKDAPDDAVVLPYPVFRDAFMNDADAQLAKAVHDGLFPECIGLFDTRVSLKTFGRLDMPKSYLYSWDDAALPHGESTGWYPKFANRLGLFRYVSMPGGHMALFTLPDVLADKIVEAGRD